MDEAAGRVDNPHESDTAMTGTYVQVLAVEVVVVSLLWLLGYWFGL